MFQSLTHKKLARLITGWQGSKNL